jgi:hypothetical protein
VTRHYTLKGHTLESVTTAKYLGITISNDMNWDTHINNITSKANKIIGFLRRNRHAEQLPGGPMSIGIIC